MSKLPPHPFTDSELTLLLEVARVALQDADMFDDIVTAHDIADEEMRRVQSKLVDYMEG